MPPEKTTRNDVVLAIMGPSGSGKSTFINLASGKSSQDVSIDLTPPCTKQAESVEFKLDERDITLLDTPGFFDQPVDEAPYDNALRVFLDRRPRIKLHGLIYLHDISTGKMTDEAKRSVKSFFKICEENATRNFMFVTHTRGQQRVKRKEERENSFRTEVRAISNVDVNFTSHDGTEGSAHRIIRSFNTNLPPPAAVLEEDRKTHGGCRCLCF